MTLVELGALLRQTREDAGLTEQEVATRLKISPAMVTAVEEGNPEGFPHRVYARGNIRTYASMMGVSAEDIASALADLDAIAPVPSPVAEKPHEETASAQAPVVPAAADSGSGRGLVFCLLLAALVGAGFMYKAEIIDLASKWCPGVLEMVGLQPSRPDGTVTAPEGMTPVVPIPEKTPEDQARPKLPAPLVEPAPAAPAVSVPAPVAPAVKPAEPNASAPESVKNQDSETRKLANPVPGAEKTEPDPLLKGHSLEITASQPMRITLRLPSGKKTRVNLQADKTFSLAFEEKETVRVYFPNAGAVRCRLDGVDLPEMGQLGEKKNVTFPVR